MPSGAGPPSTRPHCLAPLVAQLRLAGAGLRDNAPPEGPTQGGAALPMPASPRRYLTAYALWLFWPFYPFYALYLGRDAHCWLYSITFGGLGLGWLVDGFCMPLYIADHNEPEGYLERAERRHNAWVTWTTMLFPVRWLVLAVAAGMCALLGAYLVPADAVLEPLLAGLFTQATGSTLNFSGASGSRLSNGRFWIGSIRLVGAVCAAALGLRLATPCVFTVRRKCCFR